MQSSIYTIPEPVFEFLHPVGGQESPEVVVNFFCGFYNHRAVPGQKAIPTSILHKLGKPWTQNLTHQQLLDFLAQEQGSNLELLVIPGRIDSVMLGVILYPRTNTAIIYNWTDKTNPAARMKEVSHLLVEGT